MSLDTKFQYRNMVIQHLYQIIPLDNSLLYELISIKSNSLKFFFLPQREEIIKTYNFQKYNIHNETFYSKIATVEIKIKFQIIIQFFSLYRSPQKNTGNLKHKSTLIQ